jgi:hypothetical protein
MPYKLGQPIPPGYRVESRPYRAKVAIGSGIFGASYLVSFAIAAAGTEASSTAESHMQVPYDPLWLWVPIVGPWISLVTTLKSHDCRNSYFHSSYFYGECESATRNLGAWVGFLVMDGLAQAAGVVVAIAGIKSRWYQLVLTEGVQVQVLPVPMGRAGEGLALVGRFSGL